jgi:2-aminoadipate transaminase
MCDALRERLPPSARFIEPAGGFFIWLELPEAADTLTLLTTALAQNVEFMPGVRFSSRQGLGNCMRLSFAFYDTLDLLKGIERLASVVGRP